ncbi:hypothetical protein VE00_09774 [Pseudogymnoascus sp. WSF 3629]|nr:hypothetical protein VE00_09774 [Pseudogymnoascus sp. WSF 3629]
MAEDPARDRSVSPTRTPKKRHPTRLPQRALRPRRSSDVLMEDIVLARIEEALDTKMDNLHRENMELRTTLDNTIRVLREELAKAGNERTENKQWTSSAAPKRRFLLISTRM